MGEKSAGDRPMSVEQFLNMGGYGWYVWPSYGLTALVLLINYLSPMLQRKQLLRQLALKQKRGQR
jgi:heme exporter protein D